MSCSKYLHVFGKRGLKPSLLKGGGFLMDLVCPLISAIHNPTNLNDCC
jgi:hypothetical protein